MDNISDIKSKTTFVTTVLIERCKYDIDEFLKTNSIDTYTIPEIANSVSSIGKFLNTDDQYVYSTFKTWFNTLNHPSNRKVPPEQSPESEQSKELSKDFEYSHDVPLLNPPIQNEIWIVRTLMFYRLLIDVSKLIESKYAVAEYKLGIFGSITPTSDIDIGITYKGKFTDDSHPLSFVIQTFEDLIIEKMGVDSLKMDIEMYADLLTYTKDDIENYYMDTREITFEQFLEIAPYIGAGIMRNYIQSDFDLGYKEDVRRQVPDKTESGEKKTVKGELDQFASDMKNLNDKPVIVKPFLHFIKLIFKDANQNSVLEALFGNDAINIVNGYLSLDYNAGRNQYYELVKAAETTFSQFLTDKNKKTVFDLMKQTSHALVYRAESYVFSNTVMDVVRGFQAKEYKLIETTPNLCNQDANKYAPCIIGPYGYVISLLENIGYIYRFYRTYCVKGSHFNQAKCNKKIKNI